MKAIGIWALLLLVACDKAPPYEGHAYSDKVDKSRTSRNIRIPKELRDVILAGSEEAKPEEPPKSEHSEEPKKEGEEVKAPPPPPDAEFDRGTLRVFLHEKTQGVLKGQNLIFEYNSGGGELDLAEVLSQNRRGTFYFAAKPQFEEIADFEVYFWGNSKERKLGDEILGGDCRSFHRVTSYFKKQMKGEGFAVNTSDQRHVSALQGVYFFVFKKESGRIGLVYLEVKDSRFPQLSCR